MRQPNINTVPISSGVEVTILKNPTATQVKELFAGSSDKVVKYFADPQCNLHMWNAFELNHGDLMKHIGVAYSFDNYQGAGRVHSAQEAANIVNHFSKIITNMF